MLNLINGRTIINAISKKPLQFRDGSYADKKWQFANDTMCVIIIGMFMALGFFVMAITNYKGAN